MISATKTRLHNVLVYANNSFAKFQFSLTQVVFVNDIIVTEALEEETENYRFRMQGFVKGWVNKIRKNEIPEFHFRC